MDITQHKVEIGSSALTGLQPNELLADYFLDAEYPRRVKIINHMPRPFNHGPLDVRLGNCAGGIDVEKELTMPSVQALQTLCTEAEVIARLNGYEIAIEIVDVEDDTTFPNPDNQETGENSASTEPPPPAADNKPSGADSGVEPPEGLGTEPPPPADGDKQPTDTKKRGKN